jgi:hypothetical protein
MYFYQVLSLGGQPIFLTLVALVQPHPFPLFHPISEKEFNSFPEEATILDFARKG